MTDHCAEFVDKIFAYIDKELPEEELLVMAEHLEKCGPCEAERRAFERIKEMVSGCPLEAAPDRLKDRIRSIIVEAKEAG
jgi:mycothiol system anti-sigma-R factor